MTTTSPFTAGTFEINAAGPAAPGGISLQTYNGNGRLVKITVRRVDFLDEVASKLGVTILDQADVPALITAADLNATHLGKYVTVTSPEGWEASGVLYSVEHNAPQVDVGTLKELDPQRIPGRPATVLEVGPFQFEATGAETVRVHS